MNELRPFAPYLAVIANVDDMCRLSASNKTPASEKRQRKSAMKMASKDSCYSFNDIVMCLVLYFRFIRCMKMPSITSVVLCVYSVEWGWTKKKSDAMCCSAPNYSISQNTYVSFFSSLSLSFKISFYLVFSQTVSAFVP